MNKEHYSAGFDNIVIGLNDEISSLKRKIFILETELEQFKNKAEIKKGSSKDPLYCTTRDMGNTLNRAHR